jgi:NADPH-dependent curcumin reductase CurA
MDMTDTRSAAEISRAASEKFITQNGGMCHVDWAPSDFSAIITRWFHDMDAALCFANTRKIAVVYDNVGKRIR